MDQELFSFEPENAITPLGVRGSELKKVLTEIGDRQLATYAAPTEEGEDFATRYTTQLRGETKPIKSQELRDQFLVFQLSKTLDGPAILETSQVTPELPGSDELPDILMRLSMESLHLGKQEAVTVETKATTRVAVSEEDDAVKGRELLTWTLAAGLDLWNEYKNKQATSDEAKADSRQAFGGKPIEIEGGLSVFSFDVVKHKKPKWWREFFKIGDSPAAQTLASLVGFPALTLSAVRFLDGFLTKLLREEEPEVLFSGRDVRLALTEKSRDLVTGGSQLVQAGCLNKGYLVLVRGRDRDEIVDANVKYYSDLGLLVPRDAEGEALYEDALPEVTYVIMRLNLKQAKLTRTEDV